MILKNGGNNTILTGERSFHWCHYSEWRTRAEAWLESSIIQQAAGRLPWGHNVVLLTKLEGPAMRLVFIEATVGLG